MREATDQDAVLEVRDLNVEFSGRQGPVTVVDGVSFRIAPGESLGIVGESGSGKSVTAKSIMGLLGGRGRISGGSISFEGVDLTTASPRELRRLRGDAVAMVFQNPLSSLNPAFRIGWQVREAGRVHGKGRGRVLREKARAVLRQVGIANPEVRERSYPHEFSGGMRQRVVIATGVINSPRLLIADEPTTALDVTIQAQVLDLLRRLCAEKRLALMLITHNMGVVANICDRVAVMYAGQLVEVGTVDEVFSAPRHPYTAALMKSMPQLGGDTDRLPTIPGTPPDLAVAISGCRFAERCPLAEARCSQEQHLVDVSAGKGHVVRCWKAADAADRGSGVDLALHQ
ncbi:MAG: ABC transporter ATP-binding protein [Microbacterium sp.]